eukprot:NODE_10_length_61504_cov_0.956502.p23 type:complete len:363 gc:universal NODE_10_length_61504_cov_0.956502:28851-29939(+)
MEIGVQSLVRQNIKVLKSYSSARHESNAGSILLDANENSLGDSLGLNLNRYPDPLQINLKAKIAAFRNVNEDQIFAGNGSDEAIDILFRVFCEPQKDCVLICPPTYGMYSVQASIHDSPVISVNLLSNFQLDVASLESQVMSNPKLVFLCNPGNPTGTLLRSEDINRVISLYKNSIIIIDEAYIDFCSQYSSLSLIRNEKVVILQTCSKSFGLAGLRLGIAIANKAIIYYMNKVKAPYNLSQLTIEHGIRAFSTESISRMKDSVQKIIALRNDFRCWMDSLDFVRLLDSNDANFVLCQICIDKQPNNEAAINIYHHLKGLGVVVRYRGNEHNCYGSLRISIGTKQEMEILKENFVNAFNDSK